MSWKFDHKSPIGLGEFHDFCRTAFVNGADCAFINPMIGNEAVYANGWEQGIHCAHTGIEKVAYFLEEQLGIGVASVCDVNTFAFSNYFIANERFWKRYFNFIDQALELLDIEAERGSEVGQIYTGKVVRVVDFGAFVNILGQHDGLCHISELKNERVAKVTDVVNEGDQVKVKVLNIDDRGKIKLSMRVVDQETGEELEAAPRPPRQEGEGGGDRGDRGPRRQRRAG